MTEWLGLPALASAHGGQIDNLIGWIHVFMLVLFVGWGAFFLYVLVRFRRSRNPVANYSGVKSHASSYLEIGVAVVEAMVDLETTDRFSARRTTIRTGFAHEPEPVVLDWMVRQSLAMPSWAAVACYRSMLESDLMTDLDSVRIPVLQLIGELDPVHSAKGARWLRDRLADAQLVEIPGCGHYPMFEAPDELDRHLVKFLG